MSFLVAPLLIGSQICFHKLVFLASKKSALVLDYLIFILCNIIILRWKLPYVPPFPCVWGIASQSFAGRKNLVLKCRYILISLPDNLYIINLLKQELVQNCSMIVVPANRKHIGIIYNNVSNKFLTMVDIFCNNFVTITNHHIVKKISITTSNHEQCWNAREPPYMPWLKERGREGVGYTHFNVLISTAV